MKSIIMYSFDLPVDLCLNVDDKRPRTTNIEIATANCIKKAPKRPRCRYVKEKKVRDKPAAITEIKSSLESKL